MGTIFAGFLAGAVDRGLAAYNQQQLSTLQTRSAGAAYVGSRDFWDRTLQNWQSEFLAVGAMASFTVYLRQRGSPESKPVGTPHSRTGTEE